MSTLQQVIKESLGLSAPSPDMLIGEKPKRVKTTWGAEGIVLGDPTGHSQDGNYAVQPHCTIISVFPCDRATKAGTFRCAGNPVFKLPKPPAGCRFTALRVYDSVEVIHDMTRLEDSNLREGDPYHTLGRVPALAPGGNYGIGPDIVKQLIDYPGAGPGCQMGIGIIAGDLPTEWEVKGLEAGQTAFYGKLVEEADAHHRKNEPSRISDMARFALQQLGDFDPIRHPWYQQTKKIDLKNCVACGKPIAMMASVCEHCSTDLLEFGIKRYDLFGINLLKGDLALEPQFDRVLINRAAATPVAVPEEAPVQAAAAKKQ